MTKDKREFRICNGDNNVIQYFNPSLGLEYEGEKYAIRKAFEDNYELFYHKNSNPNPINHPST